MAEETQFVFGAGQLFAEAEKKIQQGYYVDAISLIEQAIDIDPTNSRYYNHIGWIYSTHIKDFETAEFYYKKALKQNPIFPPAYINYICMLNNMKRDQDVNKLLKQAEENFQVDTTSLQEEYGVMYERNKEYDKAIAAYEKARESTLNNNSVLYYEEAIDRCHKKKSHIEDLYDKSSELINDGQFGLGLEKLKTLLNLEPNHAMANANIGWLLYFKIEQRENVEEYFQKAIQLAPEDIEGYINYGIMLVESERFDEAEKVFKKGVKKNIVPKKDLLYQKLGGRLYERQEKWTKAINAYKKAILYAPNQARLDACTEALEVCKQKKELLSS